MPVVGTLRAVRFVGQAGKDTYYGTIEDDWITGGSGDDFLTGGDGSDLIDGGSDSDQLVGDSGDDLLFGGSGNDIQSGGTGNDQLDGGSGNDTADGGSGNDTLFGRSEADLLDGGAGDDIVYGGTGDDTLLWHGADNVGARDTLFGGDGNDLLRLDLTAAQWASPAFQSEYASFLTWIAGPAGSAGENGPRFIFNTLGGLTLAGTNRVEVTVDGAPAVPVDQPVTTRDDSVSVSEDGPTFNGNVLANDSVGDGVGGVALLDTTTEGTLVFNPDGSFAYTPGLALQTLAAGQTATDSFTYRVIDIDGDTGTATVSITITGANDQPVAQAISGAAGEDGATQLSPSFTDIDTGNTHSISVDTSGTRGQVSVNGDGTIRYDAAGRFDNLAAGQSTTDTFTYTVTDNSGGSSTATATVTVSGANDAPTVQGISGGTSEDGPAISLTPSFSDPDSIDLHTTGVNLAGTRGAVSVNGDGSMRYDAGGRFDSLAASETTTDSFAYTITDAMGAASIATAVVTVAGQNDGPTIASADLVGSVTRRPDNAPDFGSATHNAGGSIAFGDLDLSDSHILSVTPLGGSYRGDFAATITQNTTGGTAGAIAWGFTVNDGALADLQPGQPLTQDYAIAIDDGHGGTVTRTVTITMQGGNVAPEAFDMVTTVDEDGPSVTGAPFFFDPDAGDTFTVSVDTTGTRGAVTVNPDGTFTYDPTGRFEDLAAGATAIDTFRFTVTDSAGGASTATAEVTVVGQNDGPVAQMIRGDADEEGGTALPPVFRDPDAGDSHTITVDLTGTRGTVWIRPDGEIGYEAKHKFNDLAAGQTAIDTFTYTVTDSQGASSTSTATMTITGANDLPILAPMFGTVAADGTLQLTADFVDPDIGENRDLGIDASTALGVVTMTGGIGMQYDPAGRFDHLLAGQTASDSFRYSITDSSGVALFQDVFVTIEGRNDEPDVQNIYGTADSNGLAIALAPLFTDPDPGDHHSVTFDTAGTRGLVSMSPDGTFHYDPNGAFADLAFGETVLDGFVYTVTDASGASASAIATITVTGGNHLPVVQPLTATIGEESGPLLLTTSFTDADPGDTLSVSVDTSGTRGSVIVNPDGTFTYDPTDRFEDLASGATVIDTFRFTVTDSAGGSSTATAEVTMVGQNDGPVAQMIRGDADEEGGTYLPPVFRDPDAGDIHTITVDLTGTRGTVWIRPDGEIGYEAKHKFNDLAAGQTAIDTFTYTVTDSQGASSTSTATMTITGANDVPVAFDIDGDVDEDGPGVTLLPLFVDPDAGDVFAIDVDTSGTLGLVTINPDGTLQYDPNGQFEALGSGQTALDFFTYTITDGQGVSSTATARITVSGAFDTPPGPLFSDGNDVVDFNDVLAFRYTDSPYDALGGDDVVVLPSTAALATRAGFVTGTPFNGGAGNDVVIARGADADVIYGHDGNDTIDALDGAGADVIYGGQGDDVVGSAGLLATLYGGDGFDSLSGRGGATLYGEADDDVIEVAAAVGYGGLGNDVMIGNGFGLLMGDDGDDVMHGFAGDVLLGGEGNDEMLGSQGAHLMGEGGNDLLIVIDSSMAAGGDGADALYGGIGTTMLGERGDDTLFVASSDQTAIGGEGMDTAVFTEAPDVVDGLGGIDVERIELAGGGDVFDVGADAAGVSVDVHGGIGDDTLQGRDGNDTLSGDIGDDVVMGGAGDDTLFGGDGDDRIQGGAGNDVMSGGADVDIFGIAADGGHDTITDFQDGFDIIDATALGIGFGDITVADTIGGALIQLGVGGPSVLLTGVSAGTVDGSDFLL